MKKKLMLIITLVLIVPFVVACGGGESGESVNNAAESSTQEAEVLVDQPIDSSLEGLDLINSLSSKKPKTMIIKTEMAAYGTTTTSTAYYDGKKSRTEVFTEGLGNNILIHDLDKDIMYSYIEGSGEGTKIINANVESAEEMGLATDMNTKLAAIKGSDSNDVIAKVDTLDGEEVVYIETRESEEEMGEVTVKMWYSVKYNTPLKYEVYLGENNMMSLKVIDIQKNVKIDNKLFVPPSDINFQEADAGAMMDMMN